MGILTTSVKYGGIFLAAREGVKAIERHNNKKHAQQQQMQQSMSNQYPQQAPYQQSRDIRGSYQDLPNDVDPQQQIEYGQQPGGSFHQVWCNGRCNGKCGAKEALMALSGPSYGGQQPPQQYLDVKPPPSY